MTLRKADSSAMMVFTMSLDSNVNVIPGLNRGRLALIDKFGLIERWVCSSSFNSQQQVSDWNQRGGIMPPTSSMPEHKHWEFHTKRLFQPGQPVDDGYLITFKGSTEYKTLEGAVRSELMVHDDKNRNTNPGSYGCIFTMSTTEWDDLTKKVEFAVSHLPVIPLFCIYTY